MERKRTQKLLAALTAAAMAAAAFPAGVPWVYAAEGAVHDYGKPGDDPATEADESAAVYNSDVLKSASYAESTKYGVTANGTAVTAYKYQHSTTEGNKYYKMDVVRFSSDDAQPEMAVTLKNGSTIENVTVYPQRYYPQEALTISADKKTVSFKMSSALRYCIVYINGSAVEQSGHPALTIINDPTETNKPDIDAANVLNFGTFSKQYLADNPINDTVGEVCTVAGTVTSTSETVLKGHSYSYDTGYYVDYDTSSVTFPNKRVRLSNDVTDAFQAALAAVAADANLDTIYIPAGSYVWSGLSIKDWDGEKNGALNIYLDEDALMVNRLQECQEAMEPAIGIWNSSKITISGRGIIDGQGTYNYERDSQGAGISCHQGGCMVVQSSDITFNDTYMRDAKQWNWECHTGKNVTYNNIKGLSPYEHSWVDGLDITSGQDITINGALTLGYDDTFATGHYNPNNYFAPQGTDSNFDAATIIYNDNYDKWDTEDTLNYSINNTLGWTTKANGAQFGFALNWKDYNAETGKFDASYQQKNYEFNNLNSVLEYTGNAIRIMNGQAGGYPRYETIVFKDCSFDGSNGANAQFPNTTNLTDFNPNITMENCWFNDSSQEFYANSVNNFTIKDLYVDNKLVKYTSQINYSFENIGSLTFLANGENVTENTLPEITYPADGAAFESYAKQPVAFTVKAADADGDKVSFGDIETDITNASFDKTTGKFVWTPSESDIGKTYSVTFSAYDYTYDYSSNKSSVTVKISVGDGSSNEYAVIAAADAEVHQWSSQTGSNYGTQNYVTISGRSGDNKTAYFNFDLTDIKSSCSDYTKAVLALTYIGGRYGNNGTETLNAGAVIDTWDESSITWSNKPSFTSAASGTLVTGSTGINNNFGTGVAINGTVAKIDITDLVKSAIENGDTALSLGVSSANNANEEMYFVSREGAAGGLTNAVSSMAPSIILSVPTTEVSISGTTAMTLGKNYKATETDSYLVKGNDVKVTLSCDEDTDGRITWDSATNQIKIAEGLAVGDYNVTLTASNGTNTDTAAFALSVIDKEIVVIKAAADTDVHSYSGDYQKSYSGNNYLSVNLNDSDNGTFGENLAGATGDGKIAYINFDISALKSYDLSKANTSLVLTYMGTRASTGSARINVAAAASYTNGMNWTTKPAIDTSVVKSSDTITLKDTDSDVIGYNMAATAYVNGKTVTVDITDLVKAALDANKTELTLAICSDTPGNGVNGTFYFVSNEGAVNLTNATADMAPKLSVSIPIGEEEETKSFEEIINEFGGTVSDDIDGNNETAVIDAESVINVEGSIKNGTLKAESGTITVNLPNENNTTSVITAESVRFDGNGKVTPSAGAVMETKYTNENNEPVSDIGYFKMVSLSNATELTFILSGDKTDTIKKGLSGTVSGDAIIALFIKGVPDGKTITVEVE